jgi:DNA-binding LytR/AlgR family response regulator
MGVFIFVMGIIVLEGGAPMKFDVKIDEKCAETSVTIVAREMGDEVNELLNRLSSQQPHLITGVLDDNVIVVEADKIIRVYAENKKVYISTDDGEYYSKLRLYQFEERLPANEFVRISNSEIVNLKKIRDFDLSFSGSICVRFQSGCTTFVSRRYVSKIKNILGM